MSARDVGLVSLEAVAFWSSRLPGWELARAVIRGEAPVPQSTAPRPAPMLLAPTERRRAPDTVALALEVAARACEAAQLPPAQLPSVFASTHGDLAISDYMCTTLAETPSLISPTKFHNSVHNAAAGYWTIGTGCFRTYTAISAWHYTFAAGLLEAATQALCDACPVLYVAFDVEAKGPLATVAPSKGMLGVGLIVSPHSRAATKRRSLSLSIQRAEPEFIDRARSAAAACIADNALAPCFPFVEALAHAERSELLLQLSERTALRVALSAECADA